MPSAREQPRAQSEDQAVALAFFDVRTEGRDASLRDLFAADATWTIWGDTPLSGTHRGREAIFEGFLDPAAALFEAGALTMEIQNVLGTGPLVAVEFTATNRTVSGSDYRNQYVSIFEIKNGQIQHVREYTDTQYLRTTCF